MPIPLILRADFVSPFDGPDQRSRHPGVAIVYSTVDGRVEMLDDGRPLAWREQMKNRRYLRRFAVDTSDHHSRILLHRSPPPARGGVYHFPAEVSVGFRVVDPVEVVSRNIQDGLAVVAGHVVPVLRDITSMFRVEEAREAEEAANQRFRLAATIGGFIELYACRVRLEPPPELAEVLQREEAARLENQALAAEHQREADQARRRNELALIEQSGRLQLTEREREALAGRPTGLQDLIALYLEANPGDIRGAIKLTADLQAQHHTQEREAEDREWDRAKYLAEKNLMQPGEMINMGKRFRSSTDEPASQLAAGHGGWDEELPEPKGESR